MLKFSFFDSMEIHKVSFGWTDRLTRRSLKNTPGTRGGPGMYLLVMPKYWGKQIFTHGSFPEVGPKQKTERKKKKERERERLNDGNNNGQIRIATPPRVG